MYTKNEVPSSRHSNFISYDLDLDPMTMILKFDIDILNMYL